MAPLFPLAELPVLRAINPLVPEEPETEVLSNSEPLLKT